MFKKILIANRGEIACRVASTAKKMAIRTVALHSTPDQTAKHVAACDESIALPGETPRETYLQWQKILQAAKQTGAEAIHPGYGFLSENADFATACATEGLVFIGPPPAAIKAMGLKAESKRLMAAAGVPLVPGYHGEDQNPERLQTEADHIGYPVLIKASAGGGGKGMRVVTRSEDFIEALASCRREAAASFANDAVLIEKYVQRPRHIEIQVFGDQQGHYVYLFERDCSVQRRHQKVLEEAPAPGMTESLRRRMGEAAVAAARAVGYVGAGTVEFIAEQRGGQGEEEPTMEFFFMEMNTRLQVEHPVTEAITGLDLVEWQLRVAAGEPLPLRQDELRMQGHAIEARICAENPDNQFLPSTGTLAVYRTPEAENFERGAVRIDDGVREGDTITPFYDSMIAKLIVHGDDRQQALARLDAALARMRIVGLPTNVQFLRRVLASDSFAHARLDTALIERERAVLFDQDTLGRAPAIAAAVVRQLADEEKTAAPSGDPFARRDGWRSHGAMTRPFDFEHRGDAVRAVLARERDGSMALTVDGATQPLSWSPAADDALDLRLGADRLTAFVHRHGDMANVFTDRGASVVRIVDPLAHAGHTQSDAGRLTAPMPGKVVSFTVAVGERVTRGQPLAVMEAMKMEHTIAAPVDGVVEELLYAPGDQVGEGAPLLVLRA
ncbi:acetyl/propionyl/methylcrotonyl-CoA carboxylase subunit alpha [Xylophilus sp. GOD-11R]|uniref:acetyl/propionyl/methylcrotonyl-CoA carboxylase subunit alpha n=1 Tax=Xylophilus sp. GOD-11R TaxID=3089814 RepID=UPI00298CF974|nr:acetyl/propionyl/methylcrotonyl-CoA carboxylase subunit alpha [Xylophilus sp. GOD-11R]WPB59377.1 acetyl/propionyl/methylcrotonyl-CoA carboxylase subunit alpha [Xylophilus sp. GOD-11R]